VDGDRFAVITAREAMTDLTRLEIAAPEWHVAAASTANGGGR